MRARLLQGTSISANANGKSSAKVLEGCIHTRRRFVCTGDAQRKMPDRETQANSRTWAMHSDVRCYDNAVSQDEQAHQSNRGYVRTSICASLRTVTSKSITPVIISSESSNTWRKTTFCALPPRQVPAQPL